MNTATDDNVRKLALARHYVAKVTSAEALSQLDSRFLGLELCASGVALILDLDVEDGRNIVTQMISDMPKPPATTLYAINTDATRN